MARRNDRHPFAALVAAAAASAMSLSVIAQPCQPQWSQLGDGLGSSVFGLGVFNGELFAGGQFTSEVGGPAFALSRVARWDGHSWSPVGVGLSGFVRDFAVLGDDLYAGGNFTHIGPSVATGEPASRVARWDGQAWHALSPAVINNQVMALEVHQGDLHAAGIFTTVGDDVYNRIARWDGTAWHPLQSTPGGQPGTSGTINAMVVFDDGGGPALFVGGSFTMAGDVLAGNIARWDGDSWARLLGGDLNGSVSALAVFDDGNGPALYAGGSFTLAGEAAVTSIARWNGSQWSAVGTLAGQFTSFSVNALAVFDDGTGPALYAGGTFISADGQTALRIAKWDGSSWSPLGGGITSSGQVNALAVYDNGAGGGPALYAGGVFNNAGGGPGDRIARWGCPPAPPTCPADWNGDGQVNSQDISAFVSGWLDSVNSGGLEADFNDDGQVNSTDISAFVTSWLEAVAEGC